jgi:hypothetical protein
MLGLQPGTLQTPLRSHGLQTSVSVVAIRSDSVTAPERGMSKEAVGPQGAPQLSGRFTDRDVGRGGLEH